MAVHRFRTLARWLLLAAVTPAAGLAACSTESSYPFYAPDAATSDADASVATPDASVPRDGGALDAAPACIDDFDASPVTCSPSSAIDPWGTCPPRPGVCGSDGRTYCSEESAASAGVPVVVGTACDQPCGRFYDGGPNVCNAVTEYCYSITQVLATTWTCKSFVPGCDAGRSCACTAESAGCAVREGGAVYVHEQGAVTIRAPASGSGGF